MLLRPFCAKTPPFSTKTRKFAKTPACAINKARPLPQRAGSGSSLYPFKGVALKVAALKTQWDLVVSQMQKDKNEFLPFKLLKNGFAVLSAFALVATLSGCDSGSSGGGRSSSASGSSSPAQIEGNISDIHGPVTRGKLEVRDRNDQVVLSKELDGQSSQFSITVPAGTNYPILLVVTPPAGPVAQVVRAVVTSPLADRMDITDITSLVVDAAFALGGLTEENITKASGGAIGLRQRQGVSAGAGGGGSGAGQSAGGVSRGGHGGHDMSGGSSGSAAPAESDSMQNMQH